MFHRPADPTHFRSTCSRVTLPALVATVAVVLAAGPLHARDPLPTKGAAAPAGAPAALSGLPGWKMPAQYSVDMVMTHEGKSMTMRRAFDGGRIRTEMSAEGTEMVMLERPEDGGAIYNIMPAQKMIMKMTPAPPPAAEAQKAPPVKVEKLGVEKLEGRAAGKYRVTSEGHTALAWFDEGTGEPRRMEAEGSVIEWKNLKAGPQPAKLFELPTGYQLMDMDEQMKEMRKLGLGSGMPGGRGKGGPGMGGMMGGMGGRMGGGPGESIGSGIGGAFGGPLGGIAGGYIGGSVGGWVGNPSAGAGAARPGKK